MREEVAGGIGVEEVVVLVVVVVVVWVMTVVTSVKTTGWLA